MAVIKFTAQNNKIKIRFVLEFSNEIIPANLFKTKKNKHRFDNKSNSL
jgi:hypothetical protein